MARIALQRNGVAQSLIRIILQHVHESLDFLIAATLEILQHLIRPVLYLAKPVALCPMCCGKLTGEPSNKSCKSIFSAPYGLVDHSLLFIRVGRKLLQVLAINANVIASVLNQFPWRPLRDNWR